ncbi:hypothetical protein C7N43_33155 [Sphingobacteriales bacterium UPWRP_1]|nr:hypothetical protein BVG80_01110 [Sphingobacteriales bacterium TSM_CSM]PSJ72640.1 hypothetical protein C7N43_33155 [Sphingobacteriales bacterium UPWRP_1]
MIYYKLTTSVLPEETGIGTQIQEAMMSATHRDQLYPNIDHSIGRIAEGSQFMHYKLHGKAKWTDLLNCVFLFHPTTLLVTEKALFVFKQFDLPTYQVFDALVHKRGKQKSYYIFHLVGDYAQDFVDWEKSTFVKAGKQMFTGMRHYRPIVDKVTIYNLQDYRQKKNLMRCNEDLFAGLVYQTLHLTQSIQKDLFCTKTPLLGMYCSKRFKAGIEAAGLTGFRFEEMPSILTNTNLIYLDKDTGLPIEG